MKIVKIRININGITLILIVTYFKSASKENLRMRVNKNKIIIR